MILNGPGGRGSRFLAFAFFTFFAMMNPPLKLATMKVRLTGSDLKSQKQAVVRRAGDGVAAREFGHRSAQTHTDKS